MVTTLYNARPRADLAGYVQINSSAMAGLARLARLAARGLLSAIFIRAGYRYLRDPTMPAQRAAQVLPWLPAPEVVARTLAAVHLTGGIALTTGIARRPAAAALAATLVPITYVGHGFWREPEDPNRAAQLTHFFKNCGLLGGLLLVAMQPAPHRAK